MAGPAGIEVGRISVKVSPNTKEFRRELKRDLEDIEKSLKVSVDVDADTGGAQAKFRAELERMRVEAARGVHVKIHTDRDQTGALAGAGAGVGAAGAEAGLKGFGGAVSAGPIGAVAIAVAAIAAAGPAMALVSGALVAIPGALAAIAAPIATITLGLDGIKAAAAQLQGPFDALKATVSSVFEQSLTPVFAQLAQVFPTLTAGMSQIAAALSTALGGIVNAVTSADGLKSLESIFQNIGTAIGAAAPGLQAFTGGLLKMAASFSGLFPQMAQVFNTLGSAFGDWVTKITTVNAQGVSPLQTALQNLGSIAASIGPVLGNLFTKGFAMLQDPTFVANMQQAIAGIGQLVNAVMVASEWFGRIASLLNGVQSAVSNVGTLFSFLGTIISGSLQAAVGAVTAGVAAIQAAISGGFNALVGIVQAAWNAAVGAIQAGISAAVAAVSAFGGQVVSAVSGFVGQMVQAGKDLIMGLIEGIKSMAGAVVDAARSVVGNAVAAAKSLLGIHSPSVVFHDIGVNVGKGLGNGIDEMTPTLQGQMADLANSMLETFQKNISPDQLTASFGDLSSGDIHKGSGAAPGPTGSSGGYDWNSKAGELAGAPIDFAAANVKQMMGDIGIGGGGLLGALMDYGVGFAKQGVTNIFHTSNVDDTIALHQNQVNRQNLGIVGR